ncbi:MAG: acyl carrier protein [Alphaproteobacteria bacterium]
MGATPDVEAKVARLVAVEMKTTEARVRHVRSFRRELGMDSISAANLLFAVEEHYGIELDPDSVGGIDSLAEVTAAVVLALEGEA